MLRLKCKLSEIDRTEIDGITTIIYFDEYYRVHKFEYSRDYSYIATFDEIDDPSLSDYRLVMELSANNKGC
jgi:hypothetical protein